MDFIELRRCSPLNGELRETHRDLILNPDYVVSPLVGLIIGAALPKGNTGTLIDEHVSHPALIVRTGIDEQSNIWYDVLGGTSRDRKAHPYYISFKYHHAEQTSAPLKDGYLNIKHACRIVLHDAFFPKGFNILGTATESFLFQARRHWYLNDFCLDNAAYQAFLSDPYFVQRPDNFSPQKAQPDRYRGIKMEAMPQQPLRRLTMAEALQQALAPAIPK